MEPTLNLQLTVGEINSVLQTIGNLPTSSGAYPLLMKIKEQAEAQIAPTQEAECAQSA